MKLLLFLYLNHWVLILLFLFIVTFCRNDNELRLLGKFELCNESECRFKFYLVLHWQLVVRCVHLKLKPVDVKLELLCGLCFEVLERLSFDDPFLSLV